MKYLRLFSNHYVFASFLFDVLKERVHSSAVVTPTDISAAMRLVFEKLHLVVEPGGAAALAAVLAGKIEPQGTALITLSGGNVDWDRYAMLVSISVST